MTTTESNSSEKAARALASLIIEGLGLPDLDPQKLDLNAPLFNEGLGLDSLDMLEISLLVQRQYGVKLKADDPANKTNFASVAALSAHIERERQKSA